MRAILCFVAALGLSVQAEASGEPVFEFRDIKAGEEVLPERLKGCKVAEIVKCTDAKPTFAGKAAFSIETSFYKGKLSKVEIVLKREDSVEAVRALRAKYGDPCSVSGTSFRPLYVWCFATGKMWLEQNLGAGLSSIEYQDDNSPPKPAPKIDF